MSCSTWGGKRRFGQTTIRLLAAAILASQGAQAGLFHTTAELSQARDDPAATTVGNRALVGGGFAGSPIGYSSVVNIFSDSGAPIGTTALSQGRAYLAATTVGNRALFGGGRIDAGYSSVVDIFNAAGTLVGSTNLSQARELLAATAVGNRALFAGGYASDVYRNVVDIWTYDGTTGTWSTAALSQGRAQLAATTVGNQALFGGGRSGLPLSSVVDIYTYDGTTGTWSTAALSQARIALAATTVGNLALFGGGDAVSGASAVVDIYDATTGLWSTAALSEAKWDLAATTVGGLALFGGGSVGTGKRDAVDIFDATGTRIGTTTLSLARGSLAATTVGNCALFAGGFTSSGRTTRVDIFELTDSCTWTGATGDWAAAANWDSILAPLPTDHVYITNGGTARLPSVATAVSVHVGAGSALSATGAAEVHGALSNAGTVNGPTGAGQYLVFHDDADGAGDFTGNVCLKGTYRPGASPAEVSFGTLMFVASSILEIELGGTADGEFDKLIVGGNLTLAGTLEVELYDGFLPTAGNSFDILDFDPALRTGTFNTVILPEGYTWDTSALYTTGEISVRPAAIPEPATLSLLALGGLALLRRRRRPTK
ncbi:MAG TPA: PEP-CTERM sorting domain-containing protein [Planctomycetota bacterium]|nr:PEP-CTERM sorting domain-containing protein [Planctomycetota bacterium]